MLEDIILERITSRQPFRRTNYVSQDDFELAKSSGHLTRSDKFPYLPNSLDELVNDTRRARYTKYYHKCKYYSWFLDQIHPSAQWPNQLQTPSKDATSLPPCIILATREIYDPENDNPNYDPSSGPDLSPLEAIFKSRRNWVIHLNRDYAKITVL